MVDWFQQCWRWEHSFGNSKVERGMHSRVHWLSTRHSTNKISLNTRDNCQVLLYLYVIDEMLRKKTDLPFVANKEQGQNPNPLQIPTSMILISQWLQNWLIVKGRHQWTIRFKFNILTACQLCVQKNPFCYGESEKYMWRGGCLQKIYYGLGF